MSKTSPHYALIDITKALAIVLMIVGHTSVPKVFSDFIFAFHMPVFFLVSGWCSRWEKYSFGSFALHRSKTLLIPFAFYSIIVIAITLFINEPMFSFTEGWQGYALWFVPVLFVSSILAKAIETIPKDGVKVIFLLICLLAGSVLSYYRILLPWTMSTVPYATFLILIGSYLKKWERFITKPRWYLLVGGFIIVALVSHFWRMDLAWNVIIPVSALTIAALSGYVMLATIASYISKGPNLISKFLERIGKETFAIMAFSQIIIVGLNKYFSMNVITKYVLLAVLLSLIIVLKNMMTNLVSKTK